MRTAGGGGLRRPHLPLPAPWRAQAAPWSPQAGEPAASSASGVHWPRDAPLPASSGWRRYDRRPTAAADSADAADRRLDAPESRYRHAAYPASPKRPPQPDSLQGSGRPDRRSPARRPRGYPCWPAGVPAADRRYSRYRRQSRGCRCAAPGSAAHAWHRKSAARGWSVCPTATTWPTTPLSLITGWPSYTPFTLPLSITT